MTDRELSKPHSLSLADLRHLHKIAAKVVSVYGDVYLPLFIRLSKELEQMEQTIDARALALRVATEYDGFAARKNVTHFDTQNCIHQK